VGLLLLTASPAHAQPALTREQALVLALEQSPRLIPFQGEVAAARARLEGARLLFQENPQLSVAAGPRLVPEARTLEGSVALSQPIDVLTRGPRIDMAQASLQAAEARLEARRVELAAEVRQAFGRALAATQRAELGEEAYTLAQQAVQTAEERLRAGAASRLEVNTARVEVGRAARERVLLRQQHAAALGELRLLLGLPEDAPLALEGPLVPAPPRASAELERDIAQALSQRADLLAARRDVAATQAQAQLTGRQVLPVPSLGASYSRDEGDSIVQGTLSFTLPVFNQNQAERGVAEAQRTQAQASLHALERAITTEVRLAFARYQAAQAAAQQYAGEVLTAMEENLSLAAEAYRAGKLRFPELLIIRRETLEARRGAIDAAEELNAAEAGLKRAIGSI